MAFDPLTLDRLSEALTVASKLTALAPLERKLERAMMAGFKAQRIQFLGRLRKRRGQFAVPMAEAVREEDWAKDFDAATAATAGPMVKALDQAARASLIQGIKQARIDLGNPQELISFGPRSPEAAIVMRRRGANRIAGINDTTRSQVRTILTQAVDEGWTYQRTEKALTDLYAGFSTSAPQKHLQVGLPKGQLGTRARLIAVTETATAYEEARMLSAGRLQAAGIAMQKRWITAGLDRVCSVCEAGEGQGWVPLDQAFDNGFDSPPAHPGCRCSGDTVPVPIP